MQARNQPLTAVQAERFRSALARLRSGKIGDAVAIARALVREAPDAADAQQLLGMALADAGDRAGGETAFRQALALSPGSPAVALNFAAWLRRSGRPADALAVLDPCPDTAPILVQQGLAAAQLGDHRRARDAFQRALEREPESVSALHGLGNVLRGLGEHDAAAACFRRVTVLVPGNAAGWFGLGAAQRMQGRIEEALSSLQRARVLGMDSPELHNAINGTLYDAGRPREALSGARALLSRFPGHLEGHRTLAGLLWEAGTSLAPGEDPLQVFRDAVRSRADDRPLRLALVRMLLSARMAAEALDWLQPLLRQGQADPLRDWHAAECLSALGLHAQADARFEAAQRHLGDDPALLGARARHAFRAGQPDLAEACATRAVAVDAHNPDGWSLLGLAWRLSGDPREDWLFGYERLVGYVEVAPPPGHGEVASFLSALAATLDAMHLAGREPVNQSVRGGSQTPGRLFGRNDPVLEATRATLQVAVERWLAGLPRDDAHPFLSRNRGRMRIVGSWSVRLRSSGRHANHIHTEGWTSSAFYVALPGSMRRDEGEPHAGWLQFGQPLEDLGLDLPPRRLLRPQPGHLALFPSYMWHGTVPFEDEEPRLTVAFDMQPR